MAAQRGKDILLKVGDGAESEAFTTVAGLRARTISLNAKSIDATDSDSAGRWRELLAGAGVRSASVSGAGVFRDAASDAMVRTCFFNQTATNWQLIVPDFGVLQGPFLVAALEYAGDHEGEATYALTLASAGEIAFGRLMSLSVNPARGEVVCDLAGVPRRLCLTLGALAELEGALGVDGFSALAQRLRSLTARDLSLVLAALLRGGGEAAEEAGKIGFAEAAKAVAAAFEAAGR